jgi:hypothetical protein
MGGGGVGTGEVIYSWSLARINPFYGVADLPLAHCKIATFFLACALTEKQFSTPLGNVLMC